MRIADQRKLEDLPQLWFLNVPGCWRVALQCDVRARPVVRPSQALHEIPDPYPELRKHPSKRGKLVALPVLCGVQHDYRLAA